MPSLGGSGRYRSAIRTDQLFFKRFAYALLVLIGTMAIGCPRSEKHLNRSNQTALSPFIGPSESMSASGVMVGAGDIGMCGTGGAEATARLLDSIAGTVFTTGDNAYMMGTMADFRACYEPSWGRHRDRTNPTPGNHEYASGGGADYYNYFGASAGPGGAGYYSYAVGPWRIYALNSEVPSGPGSPQGEWLRRELSSRPTRCTAAIWHRPLFSSGSNGDNPDMRELWRILYEADVDVVINGHDHTYERFSPQDPDGRPDQQRGLRQFIVGTGGASLYPFVTVRGNSEVRASVWGVAAFTLSNGGYQWEFIPVEGSSFRDSGFGSCH
jgi:hypothetical protein